MTELLLPTDTEGFVSRRAGAEPLPGYRLIEPLGRGGYGEVWKCEVPGGLYKAVKFVGDDPNGWSRSDTSLRQEYEAFQRVKAIRHPFLLMLERVELIRDELIMVMELADHSLQKRFDNLPRGRAARHSARRGDGISHRSGRRPGFPVYGARAATPRRQAGQPLSRLRTPEGRGLRDGGPRQNRRRHRQLERASGVHAEVHRARKS